MQQTELEKAIARLWRAIPLGYGKDFNIVLKELERRGTMLNQ